MKLKEIRQAKGLTQQQLSVESGIKLATIQKLESGANGLSGAKFSTVLALYRALGIDVFIAAGMPEEEINNEKIVMIEELMKSEYVQKRYNQIMSSKGTAEAEKWLGMLVRTVKVEHA